MNLRGSLIGAPQTRGYIAPQSKGPFGRIPLEGEIAFRKRLRSGNLLDPGLPIRRIMFPAEQIDGIPHDQGLVGDLIEGFYNAQVFAGRELLMPAVQDLRTTVHGFNPYNNEIGPGEWLGAAFNTTLNFAPIGIFDDAGRGASAGARLLGASDNLAGIGFRSLDEVGEFGVRYFDDTAGVSTDVLRFSDNQFGVMAFGDESLWSTNYASAKFWDGGRRAMVGDAILELPEISAATMNTRTSLVDMWARQLGFEKGTYIHGLGKSGNGYFSGGAMTNKELMITGHAFEGPYLEAHKITSAREIAAHEWAHRAFGEVREWQTNIHAAKLGEDFLDTGTPWLTPTQASNLRALGEAARPASDIQNSSTYIINSMIQKRRGK